MHNISSASSSSNNLHYSGHPSVFAQTSHIHQLHIPQLISSTTHHTLLTKTIHLKSNEVVIPSRFIHKLLTGRREHISYGGHVYVKTNDETFVVSEWVSGDSSNNNLTRAGMGNTADVTSNQTQILCSIYQCLMHKQKYNCKAQIRFYPSIHTYVHVKNHCNHPMPSPQSVMTLEDEENEQVFQDISNLSSSRDEAEDSHDTMELLYSTKTLAQVYKNPYYTKTKRGTEFLKSFATVPNVLVQFASAEQFKLLEELTCRDHLYIDGPIELYTEDTRFMFVFHVRKEGSLNTVPCLYSFTNEISELGYKTLFGCVEMLIMKNYGVEEYFDHKKKRGNLQISCDFDQSMRNALKLLFKHVDLVGNKHVLASAVERFIDSHDLSGTSSSFLTSSSQPSLSMPSPPSSTPHVFKSFPDIRAGMIEDLQKLSKLTQRQEFLRKKNEFELKWSFIAGDVFMKFLREYFFGYDGELAMNQEELISLHQPLHKGMIAALNKQSQKAIYEPQYWACSFNPNICDWNVTSDHVTLHNQMFFKMFSVNELNERFTTWNELVGILKDYEFLMFKDEMEFSQNPLHVLKCLSEVVASREKKQI
ncbi:hypothetical protein FDP41_008307 [Naegleria fowleri]|uniref:Uncharacterized protein n=1 Tax=Naegleria fowleri TaxID=5763 RepID=A0A6A5B3Z1_NAEFO|nr:uncharacterized protein FDP41_008307 [Naegleria fowleri]KAF0973603.1 hypothetical protein FDP41_008307 [Naegleria fowleri]CAG4717420.1 unnamed protein product [Naegleria fowleri]